MAMVRETAFVLLLGLYSFTLLITAVKGSCHPNITQEPPACIIDGKDGQPSHCITDRGNVSLTLTCNVNASPFTWVYVLPGGSLPRVNCDETDASKNTCTFLPRRNDTNKEIQCSQNVKCMPNIYYPPDSNPVIYKAGASGSKRRKRAVEDGVVKKNGIVACYVEGGRPPVESVHLSCTSPPHPDQPNDVHNGNRTESNITLTNLTDEDGNMTCTCSARWVPRPQLYTLTDTDIFLIEFEPYFINFSRVDSPPPSQNDTTQMATLSCVVKARPAPTITIKDSNGTIFANNHFTPENNNMYVLNVTLKKECLEGVQCEATNTITSDAEPLTRRRRKRMARSASARLNCAGQPQSDSSASLKAGLGGGLGGGGAAVLVCVGAVVIWKRRRQNKEQSCEEDKKKQKTKADKKNQKEVEDESQDIEMSVPADAPKRENRTGAYEEAWDINNLTPGEKTTVIVQQVADDVPADGAVYSTVGAKHSGLGNQRTRQPEVNPGGPDGADQTYNRIGDVTKKTPENIYDRTN